MACNPSDRLELANELNDSSNETKLRTSISRSYYCAYHACLEYLNITDAGELIGGSGGVHQKRIDFLQVENKPASYILINLKVKRTLADYNLSESVNQDDAKATIELVNRLLEKISAV